MDLTPYLNRLREDLTAAASAGDEQTRQIAAVLGAALEPAARLTIMNALSDLAAEVTAALPDQVVEVRLDGRDVRVAVSTAAEPKPKPKPGTPPPPKTSSFAEMGGDISRMTLRLVDQIKDQAERAAAEQGMSLNAWVSQAVQGALHGEEPPGARPPGSDEHRSHHRIHGWVQG